MATVTEPARETPLVAEAGADVIFIESPETPEEMRTISERIGKPLFANMVEGGRTPLLSAAELQDLGYAIAIFPAVGFLAVAKALQDVYGVLQRDGVSSAASAQQLPFEDMNLLMGFDEVWDFDKQYGDAAE